MRFGRRSALSLMKKQRAYYLLALPGIVYFLVFHYLPMFGITIAFKDYTVYRSIAESPWVGLDVFKRLFSLRGFNRALSNTIIISLLQMVTGFPISVIIALMINELRSRRYSKYIQTTIILPHFISWVVIYGLIYGMLSPNVGLIKGIYSILLPNAAVPNLLMDKRYFRLLLVLSNIWKNTGFASIMYTAAITGIDQQLYESARLDGAGRWKQMLYVTLPGIQSTILIMLILRVGSIMSADFEQVFTLLNPTVRQVGDIIDTFVYEMGLKQAEYSLSTAAGLFKSVISLIFVLGTNAIVRRVDRDSALL